MLHETQIGSSTQLNELTAKLSAMMLRREIKLLEGSFDLNAIVHAQFREKSSGQVWELHCANDGHGGGYLRKI